VFVATLVAYLERMTVAAANHEQEAWRRMRLNLHRDVPTPTN
jgi:hypothetical protein